LPLQDPASLGDAPGSFVPPRIMHQKATLHHISCFSFYDNI